MASSEDIAYSAIVQNAAIAAEIKSDHDAQSKIGTFRNVALSIAAQAGSRDVACVTTNRMTAYYLKQDNGVVVAIAKDSAAPRVLVAFLREVDAGLKESFGSAPTSSTRAGSGARRSDLQSILQKSFEKITTSRDSLRVARSEMDKVKQIVVENIDRLLERGERVNLLVDRTGEMSNSANIFNRQASQLKRKMWVQNVKVIIAGAVLLTGSCFAISRVI